MSFTHLHVHTEYSLLDGSSKIKELVKQAKELGMESLAITDHGVMYGVIDFYRACKAVGLRPILGCEIYVAPGSRFDREASVKDDRYYHLVLLAENNQGYQNLMKIVSRGFTEGFYYKPRVDYEILEAYHEGIIALSACLAGEVASNIRRGFFEEAKTVALRLQDIFGEGNFFLELQDHGLTEQQTVNSGILRLHEQTNIPLIATNDVHYTFKEDADPHDILLCVQTQKKVKDENRMRYEGGQYYLKSPEEMKNLFGYALEALENTERIANRCEVEIVFGEYKLPVYPVPNGFTAYDYLIKLCSDGLVKRYGEIRAKELHDRLMYELETIHTMGFVDYFLIVWDFIKYAKDNRIAVGPGRGSAAGSIVAYCLEITDIDPIRFNLLFERFLNPERLTMPDIDIDFCFERRQEVIDYVTKKYGKERVVQIVTFGTMAARGVIRDVGRVLDMPYAQVDRVAKMIPTEIGITIDKALESSKEFKELYEEDTDVKYLIDMSKRLEGLPRHTSMHAAGVVISKESVDEYVPLSRSSDDSITTQFTMTTLEELGLLKMDFLGLRTLTVIQSAVDIINQSRTDHEPLDIDKIDYADKNVYDMISSARTEGVFQLESSGMKSFMKELKPQSIEDVIAGISLYRPGPMDFIPKYIKGKNEQDSIKYECAQLEPILSPTYGCIVYQEQVMQIVRDLAGYSYGRSDLVRRAMSKKKADVMARERQNFVYGNEEEGVKGCIANGISEKIANQIFDEMTDFAKYAFNKSHAAAYAVVAYQTAYLKYYFPIEFMAALMTSVIDNPGKVTEYIYACRQMKISILPPDINVAESSFTVSKGAIRYGMSAIKGLGKPVIEAIVLERKQNGLYKSLSDFTQRLSGKEVNKRTVESLIKAGAFMSIHDNRRMLMLNYVRIIDGVAQDKKRAMTGQMSLFDLVPEESLQVKNYQMEPVSEYSKEEMLALEKEVLGVYLSGHPLENYIEKIQKYVTANSSEFIIDDDKEEPTIEDGKVVTLGGMIAGITTKLTRNNSNMAFLTLEDLFGTVEIIVFPRDYEKYRQRIHVDAKLFIKGKVVVEEEKNAKLIAQEIISFDDTPDTLWIKFETIEDFQNKEDQLYDILEDYPGKDKVWVYCEKERKKKPLLNFEVQIGNEILSKLYSNFGQKNIKVVL